MWPHFAVAVRKVIAFVARPERLLSLSLSLFRVHRRNSDRLRCLATNWLVMCDLKWQTEYLDVSRVRSNALLPKCCRDTVTLLSQ